MRTRDTYFYVISDGTAYKIGIGYDPHVRMSSHQTGNPNRLRMVYKRRFDTREEAAAYERDVINELETLGRETPGGTEWFILKTGDLNRIKRGLRPGRSIAGYILYFIIYTLPSWFNGKNQSARRAAPHRQ